MFSTSAGTLLPTYSNRFKSIKMPTMYIPIMITLLLYSIPCTRQISNEHESHFNLTNHKHKLSKEINAIRMKREEEELSYFTAKICQRYSYLARFDELFFGTIIMPRQMDIGFCAGDCDLAHLYVSNKTTNALYRSVHLAHHPDSQLPKTCCMPATYRKVTIKTATEKGLDDIDYNDLFIHTCSCQ